jgi:hypothetical protein
MYLIAVCAHLYWLAGIIHAEIGLETGDRPVLTHSGGHFQVFGAKGPDLRHKKGLQTNQDERKQLSK